MSFADEIANRRASAHGGVAGAPKKRTNSQNASARGGVNGSGALLGMTPPVPPVKKTGGQLPGLSQLTKGPIYGQLPGLQELTGAQSKPSMYGQLPGLQQLTGNNISGGASIKPKPKPSGNGGPVKSGGGGAKVFDDGLDALYKELYGNVSGLKGSDLAMFDAALKAITGDYKKASADNYNDYASSTDSLSEAAKNLGVDFKKSSLGLAYSKDARRMQETADSNLMTDKSWIRKMKLLTNDDWSMMLAGINQDKLTRRQELALKRLAAASGGSGGSGRSGGSSKNGSVSTSATETNTVTNVGDIEAINELKKTNPAAAQIMLNYYLSNKTDPLAAVANIGNDSGKANSVANSAVNTALGLLGKVGVKPKKPIKKPIKFGNQSATAAMLGLLGFSGKLGNPSGKQVVTSKGSKLTR